MTRKEALEILGLETDASLDEAKRAYRKLSLHYHPDRNSAPNASVMFRYIHDAWEYIQNDAKTGQQAQATQKQAEAERARQQTEAKNSNPDEHGVDETEMTFGDWFWCGGCLIFVLFGFVGIGTTIHSCATADRTVDNSKTNTSRTSDKPVESSKENIFVGPPDVEGSKTYIDQGKAKADIGEYFEAISDYDMAISLNPANAKTYHYRGVRLVNLDP